MNLIYVCNIFKLFHWNKEFESDVCVYKFSLTIYSNSVSNTSHKHVLFMLTIVNFEIVENL